MKPNELERFCYVLLNFNLVFWILEGELGPKSSLGSGLWAGIKSLQNYLQINYQQGPHVGSEIRTHVLVRYEPDSYQLDQHLFSNFNPFITGTKMSQFFNFILLYSILKHEPNIEESPVPC